MSLEADAAAAYRQAGTVLADVLEETAAMIEPGVRLLDVAEAAEAAITARADGCAFPANISLDAEASHASPARDDDRTFDDELVCLDLGAHVDGYIADAAVTVDLGDNAALVDAAEAALEAALAAVRPGIDPGAVGAVIEEVIRDRGFTPILNLSGHGVGRYDAHTAPSVPNRATQTGETLAEGDVVAIEPFATTGRGKVSEGAVTQIYSLIAPAPVRSRTATQVLQTVESEYRELPFAKRWLASPREELSVRRLTDRGILHGYPVLQAESGALVSQAEHTVIVTADGCEILTDG
jgi:methionyl aminopeptidase